jgi:hypothetical protein
VVRPRNENFWKLTVFGSAAKILELVNKDNSIDCVLRAAKFFGIRQQKQLKLTVSCSAAAKNLELTNKSNSN